MRIVIKVAKKDRPKAWGILVRHSAGTALPDRTFMVNEAAMKKLQQEGVKFKEISREPGQPIDTGVLAGERI